MERVPVLGSSPPRLDGAAVVGRCSPELERSVTLLLKPSESPPDAHEWGSFPLSERVYWSRQAFAQRHGTHPDAILAAGAFADEHGLTVIERSDAQRVVRLWGRVERIEAAFGVALHKHSTAEGKGYVSHLGSPTLPQALHPWVQGVFGLDDRPLLQPHLRVAAAVPSTGAGAFLAPELAKLYRFPTGYDGSGQRVALICLGGGYLKSDLSAYAALAHVPGPARVSDVLTGANGNTPGQNASYDKEITLDIETVMGAAPGADIVVYFGDESPEGFIKAVRTAVHDAKASSGVLSISWGACESLWTADARSAVDGAFQEGAAMGVTVLASSGDSGSSAGMPGGGAHVAFPASSPHAVSCGGTRLVASGETIVDEVVWNEVATNGGATGGGVSRYFGLPKFQRGAGVPAHPETHKAGRGLPDVAGDAAVATGHRVIFEGQEHVIGGTSAVAPLYAGLFARLAQAHQKPTGWVLPLLYGAGGEKAARDVTSGSNGEWSAGPGWDACTGLGSLVGNGLLSL